MMYSIHTLQSSVLLANLVQESTVNQRRSGLRLGDLTDYSCHDVIAHLASGRSPSLDRSHGTMFHPKLCDITDRNTDRNQFQKYLKTHLFSNLPAVYDLDMRA